MHPLLLSYFLVVCAFAQTPVNLGFEAGTVGQTPEGWGFAGPPGSSAVLTDSGCFEGSRCALIRGPSVTDPNAFANLSQTIPSTAYTMRRIRFQAAARVEGADTRLQFWLRIDRRGGGVIYLDNMNSRPIVFGQWATYSIEANVSEDAERIIIGGLLFGSGRAWMDAGSFSIIGTLRSEPPEPRREISDAGITNITALARLLGAVRFFHPSDGVTQQDWETFAVQAVRAVEPAASPRELARTLQDLFAPLAPTVQVYAGETPPALPADLQPENREGLRMVRQRNYGVRLGPDSNTYQSGRVMVAAPATGVPAGFEDPAAPYVMNLAPGVTARVPLTLFVSDTGTLPGLPSVATQDAWQRTTNDRTTRLATVVLAWSVLQNFYPYFDVTPVDWPAQLARALRGAATDGSLADFHATLEVLNAALSDGHGSVGPGPSVGGALPVIWDWIENGLIVTQVKDPQSGLQRGDRVLSVDGSPVEDWLGWLEARISGATPQWVRNISLRRLTYCYAPVTRIALEIEPYSAPGTRRTLNVTCRNDNSWSEPKPSTVAQLEPGIYYVDIDRLTEADWRNALPQLANANGIVFDLRGYPRIANYLSHLTREPITSAQWLIPVPAKPDQTGMRFEGGARWDIRPMEPYLNARRVFLTGGNAISFAESVMGIVEAYKLAEIVGSTTAGTNGNTNTIPLPAGMRMVFTGMKVLKHDDSRHHGVGIAPTVPTSRTRGGAAEGIDEVLRRGIDVVKGGR